MGAGTTTIEIGTAVIPTWPRHPLMLAAQALTVQEAIGNRLALGIGLAHKASVEATLKIPFVTPGQAHGRVPVGAAAGDAPTGKVAFTGDIWSAEVEASAVRPASPPPTVLARRDGPADAARSPASAPTAPILWLSGPRPIAEQIKPALDAAAAEAGRPAPRIVASVPVCVTTSPTRCATSSPRCSPATTTCRPTAA